MLNRCDFRCVVKVENVRDRHIHKAKLKEVLGVPDQVTETKRLSMAPDTMHPLDTDHKHSVQLKQQKRVQRHLLHVNRYIRPTRQQGADPITHCYHQHSLTTVSVSQPQPASASLILTRRFLKSLSVTSFCVNKQTV